MLNEDTLYIFVIDTNKYAGNFERQLCAYMTGRIGECEVGEEEAKIFNKETNTDEYAFDDERHPFQFVINVSDEVKCQRPVTIIATPGWFNPGMGGQFRDGEEKKAAKYYKKECLDYAKNTPYVNKKEWEEKANCPFEKYPAYLSVGIYMSRKPTEKEKEMLKDRAIKYTKKNKIKISAFRLIEQTINYKEIFNESQ